MQNKNCYTILGVDSKASFAEIKTAYRLLAKLHHPDKNNGNSFSEEQFKEIQQAYAILSNPEKRKKHDIRFPSFASSQYQNQYNNYDGNAYRYAQKQSHRQHQPKQKHKTKTPATSITNPTETKHLIISIMVAFMLLYLILKY